ncbi:kinase-like domain-containing protein [Mycena galericulata]|nr:kinase-like domain-containing protein [Mycena galericulata]
MDPPTTEPAIGTRPEEWDSTGAPFTHLHGAEIYWYNHRDWLKSKGYVLRARFQEGWTPSWKNSGYPTEHEDAHMHRRASVMDATRVGDGAFVMLKRVKNAVNPFEVDITTWFSAEPQRSDPQNHCVPIYDVLQTPDDPNVHILVMPLLVPYGKPHFDTVGEVVSFFRQIFEGVRYMHKQNVVHRDCTHLNIMMDASPITTRPFHPVKPSMRRDFKGHIVYLSRTQHPVRYYLTDFGLAVKYRPEDRPPLETPILGGDKSVPEFQTANKRDQAPDSDPFPVDVYYLGNLVRLYFTKGHQYARRRPGFEFMESLVSDMVNTDPAKRPDMNEVVERFERIVDGLNSWKLRSRARKQGEFLGMFRSTSHWIRKLQLVVGQYPLISMPDTK